MEKAATLTLHLEAITDEEAIEIAEAIVALAHEMAQEVRKTRGNTN